MTTSREYSIVPFANARISQERWRDNGSLLNEETSSQLNPVTDNTTTSSLFVGGTPYSPMLHSLKDRRQTIETNNLDVTREILSVLFLSKNLSSDSQTFLEERMRKSKFYKLSS